MGEIKGNEHQENLDNTDSIIDTMKDKLTELFSELNKDELEQASLMKINYFSAKFLSQFQLFLAKNTLHY